MSIINPIINRFILPFYFSRPLLCYELSSPLLCAINCPVPCCAINCVFYMIGRRDDMRAVSRVGTHTILEFSQSCAHGGFTSCTPTTGVCDGPVVSIHAKRAACAHTFARTSSLRRLLLGSLYRLLFTLLARCTCYTLVELLIVQCIAQWNCIGCRTASIFLCSFLINS